MSPFPNASDLIVSVELRRNDSGKTVGVYQERLYHQNDLTIPTILDLWKFYENKLDAIFPAQFHPELLCHQLHYFLYWTRYTTRDSVGFYYRAFACQDHAIIPDPFMNHSVRAYVLSFIFYLVEKTGDAITHDVNPALEFVQ
jgi:hypothetical protein